MGKAEWGGNPVCWWLGLYFLFCFWFRWVILHRVLLVLRRCQVLYSSGFLSVSSHCLILPRVSSSLHSFWSYSRPFRTNTQKRCPFHYRGLEWKSRKSRNTWSNRQNWPWSIEWSRAKANRVLTRERTGHSKHPLPTAQEKTLHMDITRWSTLKSDWLYSLQPKVEKLYTVSKNKTWSCLWLRSWTPYCQIQT